jgi:hypothetical protein
VTARDLPGPLRRIVCVAKAFAVSLATAVATIALLLVAPRADAGKQKPFVLTALADIGTVYWRYDCVHCRTPRVSLGIQWWGEATTGVACRAGALVRRRMLPRHRVWFPFTNERFQSLSFVQATEPRTLYAYVTIDLGRRGSDHGYHDCRSYFPPQLSVHERWR